MSVMVAALLAVTSAQDQTRHKVGFKDTPMLPGNRWHVHDSDRPLPPVITPGTCSTQEAPGKAPSDAVVLFDGNDLAHWRSERGEPAQWDIKDGALVVHPGAGAILSRDEFGDCQLHLEFASPVPPRSEDQGRGNSGVMFFGRYEIQVLDCYNNLTYADGHAAAIYGQYPPLVNASRKPGEWQSYDIIFTAPKFKEDGSLETPAYATVLAQRRCRAQPHGRARPHGVPCSSSLQAAWSQGADPASGSWQPGPVPQHLGSIGQRL